MADEMLFFGCAFICVSVGTIVLPVLFRRRKVFTTWNFFLAGSAIFVGYSAIETITKPKEYLYYTDSDYMHFMLGATLLYAILYFAYYVIKFPRRIAERMPRKWPSVSPNQLMLVFAPICSALSLIYPALPYIPFISLLLSSFSIPLAVSSLVFCVYAWQRDRLNPLAIVAVILSGSVALIIVLSTGTGRRPLISMMLAVMSTLYWVQWRYQAPGKNAVRLAIGLLVVILVIGGYSSYRHWQKGAYTNMNPIQRAMKSIVLLPSAIVKAPMFNKLLDGQDAAEASLVAIHRYREARTPEPFHAVKMVASTPIPRIWWQGKPQALGTTLPRDIGRWRFGYINWGPGIVGHMFHEGGYPIMFFYGLLFGVGFRYFDELLCRYPDNPFLLAILGVTSGQVLAFARGDIAVFGVQILFGIFTVGIVVLCGRFIFGSKAVSRGEQLKNPRRGNLGHPPMPPMPGRRVV